MRVLAAPAFKTRVNNPYTWLLYTNMNASVSELSWTSIPHGDSDIVHIHWPDYDLSKKRASGALMRLLWKLLILEILRLRGAKIVWTVHNLASHERRHPRLERWFWKVFVRRLSAVISLSQTGLDAAIGRHPLIANLPGYVIPHGHYRGEYPNDPTLDARSSLEISPTAKVLLFFGAIRPYKNVFHLLDTFSALPDTDLVLCIAGRPSDSEMAMQLKEAAKLDKRIRLSLEFIPVDQVQLYFRAADLVVLPYKEILNSGTALLALSFNCPILVPAKGSMGELLDVVGANWVRTFTGELNPADLVTGMQWALETARQEIAPLEQLGWDQISERTLSAYEELI